MDVKFLDGSVFKNRIWTEFRFSEHPYWHPSLLPLDTHQYQRYHTASQTCALVNFYELQFS